MKNQQFTLQLENNSLTIDSQNDQFSKSTCSNNSQMPNPLQSCKYSPLSQNQLEIQNSLKIPPDKSLQANFLPEEKYIFAVKTLNQSYRSPKFQDTGLLSSQYKSEQFQKISTDFSEDEEEFNRKMDQYRDKIKRLRYTLSKDNISQSQDVPNDNNEQDSILKQQSQYKQEPQNLENYIPENQDQQYYHQQSNTNIICNNDIQLQQQHQQIIINQNYEQKLEQKEIMLREMKEMHDKMYKTLQETHQELQTLKNEKKLIKESDQLFKTYKQEQEVFQKELQIKELENSQLKNENMRINDRKNFIEEKWKMAQKQLEEHETRNTRQRQEIEQLIKEKKELTSELSRIYSQLKENLNITNYGQMDNNINNIKKQKQQSQQIQPQKQRSKHQNSCQNDSLNKFASISIDQDSRDYRTNKSRISATPNTKSQQYLNNSNNRDLKPQLLQQSNLSCCSFVQSASNNKKLQQNNLSQSYISLKEQPKQQQFQNYSSISNFSQEQEQNIQLLLSELRVNSVENALKKIIELVKQSRDFQKFSQCLTDMMYQCVPLNQRMNQQLNFKDAWKWIKGIVEEYYKLQMKYKHLHEENYSLKFLAQKLNEAIQCGLINGCNELEGTLTKLNLKE